MITAPRVLLEHLDPEELVSLYEGLQEKLERVERERDQLRVLVPEKAETLPGQHQVERKRTRDGWTVATLGWWLVPGYDYAKAGEGLSEEARRQEIDIDWTATSGKVVYPEYGREHQALDPLVFDPQRPLYCGWDFGAHEGGTPAWVPTQVNTFGQWLIFPPLAPTEDRSIGTYDFGQLVADHLQREYAAPHGLQWRQLKLLHFGDPNGNQRAPRTGDRPREMVTHFQILNRGLEIPLGPDAKGDMQYERKPGFGFEIQPGPVNVLDRLNAVRARLTLTLPGRLPGLVVDPRATVIRDGFAGGYHFPKRADGSYETHPEKDWFSHSLDALAYVAACLFYQPEEDEEDARNFAPARRFRCQAAGRMAA